MAQCFTTCNNCLPPSPPTPPAPPRPPLLPDALHRFTSTAKPSFGFAEQSVGFAVEAAIESTTHTPISQTADGFWTLASGLVLLALGLVALVTALLCRCCQPRQSSGSLKVHDGEGGTWEALPSQAPTPKRVRVPARVVEAFDFFDADQSGFIDRRELNAVLRHYGVNLSAPGASAMLQRYDDTPDGNIDLIEFAELVHDLEEGMLRAQTTTTLPPPPTAPPPTPPPTTVSPRAGPSSQLPTSQRLPAAASPSHSPPRSPPRSPHRPTTPASAPWLPPSGQAALLPSNSAFVADRWEQETSRRGMGQATAFGTPGPAPIGTTHPGGRGARAGGGAGGGTPGSARGFVQG